MRRRRILWQLFPSYLFITFLSVVAIAWYGIQSQRELYLDETAFGLEARAYLVERQIADVLASGDTTGIDQFCKELGRASGTRITVILPDGKVIADSEEEPAVMDNHGNRTEVIDARKTGIGIVKRYSRTVNRNMMYVAIQAVRDSRELGVVRVSIPLTVIEGALESIRMKMVMSGLAIAILAAILSLLVSRRISLPLERIKDGAEKFASGNLRSRLEVPPVEEIGGLAEAMNSMAAQLHQRIQTIAEQRREKDAILTSMAEGVIAVDTDDRIISINNTAAKFFNIDPELVQGRFLHEAIRNVALQQLAAEILKEKVAAEDEIFIESETGRRILQASGSILRDADNQAIGAVIVLNDITKIRELENLRRDFVANASHELRTPITSIKGYIETLLDGAMNDSENLERFLNIIAKHARRLDSIVEDLLDLSRIEQGPEITFEESKICDVINSAVESSEIVIRKYNARIKISCSPDLTASMNRPLLELAVVNLLENAIKHGAPDSTVEIIAEKNDTEIGLAVKDHGKGIAPEHQDRIFERFYRVDKARSREHGGTGLGLAIVKHIVLTHRGRIEVESEPGKGSTFTIYVPARIQTNSPEQV